MAWRSVRGAFMAEATSIDRLQIEIGASSRDAADQIDQLSKSLRNLKIALRNATKEPSKVSVDIDTKAVDTATKRVTSFKKLLSSLGRVAFYRAIRTAIRTITEGFKEGLENAYWFSKKINGPLARSLDSLSSAGFRMKNQLGSAFGQLLQAIAPILIRIVQMVTWVADKITQLFAALSGQSTYLKAIDYWKEWGDAAGSAGDKAKKALRYLAPFDELNVLPSDSGSGTSGSGSKVPDYENMFKEAELEGWAGRLKSALDALKIDIDAVFDGISFDTSKLTKEAIKNAIVSGLVGAAIGFTFGGPAGAALGFVIGVGLSLVNSGVIKFDIKNGSVKSALKNFFKSLSLMPDSPIQFSPVGSSGLVGASIDFDLTMVLQNLGIEEKAGTMLDSMKTWFTKAWNGLIDWISQTGFGRFLSEKIGIDLSKYKVAIPVDEEKTHGIFRRAAVDSMLMASNEVKDKPIAVTAAITGAKVAIPQNQLAVDMYGKVNSIKVTADTPIIRVTGKMDRILKPGGGYIEIKGNGGVFANGGWKPITAYAGGGNPVGGELFLARESGPEMVGKLGGHTAVMNNNQIVASVSDGVAQANTMVVSAVYAAAAQIVNALREKELGGSGRLSLDVVAKELTRLQRNAARANG